MKEGILTPGVDVHHIRPVEHAKTVQEMERLAYDLTNCQLLCVEHHIKVHQSMHTHCKEKVKENKERARKRFLEANDPNYVPTEGNTSDPNNDNSQINDATQGK